MCLEIVYGMLLTTLIRDKVIRLITFICSHRYKNKISEFKIQKQSTIIFIYSQFHT